MTEKLMNDVLKDAICRVRLKRGSQYTAEEYEHAHAVLDAVEKVEPEFARELRLEVAHLQDAG
jgi:hypothetical protein